MINETLLVKQWLNGENIDKQIIFRMCYLLTKWYYENETKNRVEIREKIFSWAKENNLFLNINVNDCITKALSSDRRLTGDNPIRVSEEDIYQINRRFDRKNVKLCALGLLCYAKQFANQESAFELPFVAFGKWIGISYNNISNRYMRELIDFDYIEKTKRGVRRYKNKIFAQSPKIIMKVPIVNYGEWELKDNNIRNLFNKIFVYSEYK